MGKGVSFGKKRVKNEVKLYTNVPRLFVLSWVKAAKTDRNGYGPLDESAAAGLHAAFGKVKLFVI